MCRRYQGPRLHLIQVCDNVACQRVEFVLFGWIDSSVSACDDIGDASRRRNRPARVVPVGPIDVVVDNSDGRQQRDAIARAADESRLDAAWRAEYANTRMSI